MPIHKELFVDLPPAETLEKQYATAFSQWKNADGYYNLVQEIAEAYGEKAYAIAEEVFREMGLDFDPAALRDVDTVRRVYYNFEGSNIYNITIKPFSTEMTAEVVRLYNEQIRWLSYDALLDGGTFRETIAPRGQILAACDENDQPVGFVHCLLEQGTGSVEALIFGSGRLYRPFAQKLVAAAKAYFASQQAGPVAALSGRVPYPFYRVLQGQLPGAFTRLPHIQAGLREITG
jgi:hypothetical protein